MDTTFPAHSSSFLSTNLTIYGFVVLCGHHGFRFVFTKVGCVHICFFPSLNLSCLPIGCSSGCFRDVSSLCPIVFMKAVCKAETSLQQVVFCFHKLQRNVLSLLSTFCRRSILARFSAAMSFPQICCAGLVRHCNG